MRRLLNTLCRWQPPLCRTLLCRRFCAQQNPRCLCLRRRRPKEKGEEVETDDIECATFPKPPILDLEHSLANIQDADEVSVASEIPSWQIPQLVVECSQRPSARIHKGTAVILPDAGRDLIAGIVKNLPVLQQIRPRWLLGYSLAVDGVSLQTLYRQLKDVGPTILIVEDSNNCVFGAFLSEGFVPNGRCYGNHECFVFRYPRAAGAWHVEVYHGLSQPQTLRRDVADVTQEPQGVQWAGYHEALRKCQTVTALPSVSSALVLCDHTGIVIGLDGPALYIDQNLLRGVSWASGSFGSPCLAASGPDFVVRNLEVWHWDLS